MRELARFFVFFNFVPTRTPMFIIIIDINVDFINLSYTQILDCLTLFNLTNVIQEPTRIFGNSNYLIDPIIVSDACQVLDSGTISVDNSC